jgi:hypothetical protein
LQKLSCDCLYTCNDEILCIILFAGEIQKKGMVIPLSIDTYNPILSRLKSEGIRAREVIE